MQNSDRKLSKIHEKQRLAASKQVATMKSRQFPILDTSLEPFTYEDVVKTTLKIRRFLALLIPVWSHSLSLSLSQDSSLDVDALEGCCSPPRRPREAPGSVATVGRSEPRRVVLPISPPKLQERVVDAPDGSHTQSGGIPRSRTRYPASAALNA